jgi:hypothetical protein
VAIRRGAGRGAVYNVAHRGVAHENSSRKFQQGKAYASAAHRGGGNLLDLRRQPLQITARLLGGDQRFCCAGVRRQDHRESFRGTAIGAFTGAVFAYFGGSHLLWFGVAATLTVLLCEVLGLGQSYRLACVTVAIVMLIDRTASPWNTALNRFLEVALGIVIALVLSAVPPGGDTESKQTDLHRTVHE